jgi:hypothetical protein
MNKERLAEADRIVEGLSPGKRESVREIVVDAIHRGFLPESGRRYLLAVTGSELLADVLAEGVSEKISGRGPAGIAEGDSAHSHERRRPSPGSAVDAAADGDEMRNSGPG